MTHITFNSYKKYLQSLGLAYRSVKEYCNYFEKFDCNGIPTQEKLDEFILRYPNLPARATVNHYMNLLNRIIKNTDDKDEIHQFSKLELPKVRQPNRKIPQVISEQQLRLIIKEIPSERYKITTYLGFYCALRISEIFGLTVNSFNFDQWKLDQNQHGELKIVGKGGIEGIVLVPNWLMARIRNYINKTWIHKFRTKEFTKDDKIFLNLRGFKEGLGKWSQAAIGRHVNPHLLRHSFATHLHNKGWGIRDIQHFLRHKDIGNTMIYTHVSQSQIKEKYNRLMDQSV